MSIRLWLLVAFILAAVSWPLYEEHLPAKATSTLRGVAVFIGLMMLISSQMDAKARLETLEKDFAEHEAAYKALEEQYEALVERLDEEEAAREEQHDALEQRLDQEATARQEQHEELEERISSLEGAA